MSSPTNLHGREFARQATRPGPAARATNVRFAVLWVTTLTSFIMYLDRICVAEVVKQDSFQHELALDSKQVGWILGSFFFAYALSQVPAGWLSDRFGARTMMTAYVAAWSLLTGLTGLAGGFWGLLLARLGCGIAQAGAYPTSGGLLSRWIPFPWRGMANSIVAFGGRIGLAGASWMTVMAVKTLGGWREALWLYQAIGIGIALWFWWVFRERPENHPRSNAAECELIERSLPPTVRAGRVAATGIPLRAIVASPSLWCMSLVMFCTNVGWAFLATWLPTYFKNVMGLSPEDAAQRSFLALLGGMAGLLVGGWVTDLATRRWGLRWGRSGPLVICRLVGVAAYLSCLKFDSPAAVTVSFFIVAFSTDMGIGGTWAYAQDVGGRHVGSILGWANMWGNLGAALVAVVLPWVVDMEHATDWDEAFLLCAAAFLLASLAALGINATLPIVRRDELPREVQPA